MSDINQQPNPKVIDSDFTKPASKSEKEQAEAIKDLSGGHNDLSMKVKVASPFTSYFNGQAFSISAVNATGPFDILPRHHNFISLLEPCTLVIRTIEGNEQKIDIAGGLMHVKADKATVFLDV